MTLRCRVFNSLISRSAAVLAIVLCVFPALAQQVTTPDEHLGRSLGIDFELADWPEVSGYYRTLAEQSPNVLVQNVGTTTEGRDFLILIISSPENLANLNTIKQRASTLADPRGKTEAQKQAAIDNGRVILFVSCAMHSTEAAGSQFSMQFAHELATSNDEPWRSARQQMVTVVYTTNPDGVDHVTEWYRENVGTPHEGTGLLKLYQYYSGHDNNRDWFMLTQKETQIVTRMLYSEWYPQVYWDVHQQGSRSERFFVPPFRDPLNPNLDPAIITGIDALGSRVLMDMTREGFTGISTGVSYDMWWAGGNRNIPVRHNIIGLLSEAASVRLASPIFLTRSELSAPRGIAGYAPSNQFPNPWPGGWWRLRDIIDYEMGFGRSLVGSLSREPQYWLRNSMEAAQRTISKADDGAPRAWLIPSDNRDPDAVRHLVDVLFMSGVEMSVTDRPLTADGRNYPAGTIVIMRAQPYGSHVKDLFEVQRYPEGQPPYDVAGWSLPYLLGVRRVEVMQELEVPLRPVMNGAEATVAFGGDTRLAGEAASMSSHHSSTWTRVIDALQTGDDVTFISTGDRAGLFVPGGNTGGDDAADERSITLNRMPRIGLYSPWSGSMDEGWTRYVFDTFEVPYQTVRNEMLRAGNLSDFIDVLIVPSIGGRQLDEGRAPGSVAEQYTRGLAPEGAVAVEEFVRSGGTVLCFGSACQWAIDLFEFPLLDVTRGEGAGDFSCPGSVLRGIPSPALIQTAGLPDSVPLFFSRSAAFRQMTDDERDQAGLPESQYTPATIMRYAPTRVLLSGWIRNPKVIEGEGAWIASRYGEGTVHLFGFRPQYRGWAHSTFPLIFRAMLFAGQE